MPAPTVTAISPKIGGVLGGASVTLTGTNFTGTTGVTIGGVAATSVVVVSPTSITCIAPAGAAGVASVLVTNASGTNAANSLFFYVAATPTDVYIYLKGGRGDGFVPLWTGTFRDVEVDVKSDPYRNIFPSTQKNPEMALQSIPTGDPPGSGLPILSPYEATKNITYGYIAGGDNVFTGSAIAKMSDEVAGTAPRQFVQVVTYRLFLSSNGLEYSIRLALFDGIGGAAR